MKKLSSLLLVTLFAGVATGCVVRTRGHVRVAPVAVVEVDEAPPPPRHVVVQTRPGFVYIRGHWTRRGSRWVWLDGRWERERANHAWVQGRWETRGRRHVWVKGHWEAHRGPAVRDHRDRRDHRRGPVVRDHR